MKTEKDANGNVRHTYRKVETPAPQEKVVTSFVNENGEKITPDENGEQPSKDIPGYELVRTEKDANGNVRHIYRKVETPAPKQKVVRQELPQTGTGQEVAIFGAAASAILSGLGLAVSGKTKKEEE